MDLGPICIKCNKWANIDKTLLESLIAHFTAYEEANVSLRQDEFLEELIKAYIGGYIQALIESGNLSEDDIISESSDKLTPVTVEVIDSLIGNIAKSTLLLRQLAEISNQRVHEIEAIAAIKPELQLNGDFQNEALIWKTVASLIKL